MRWHKTFERVQPKRQNAQRATDGPEDVGGTDISAAYFADVHALAAAQQQTERDSPEQISCRRTQQPCRPAWHIVIVAVQSSARQQPARFVTIAAFESWEARLFDRGGLGAQKIVQCQNALDRAVSLVNDNQHADGGLQEKRFDLFKRLFDVA